MDDSLRYESAPEGAFNVDLGMNMHMNMTMKMKEYFFFSTDIKHLFFEGLHFKGTGGVIGCCLMLFCLTVVLEGGKALVFYLQLRLQQNPLTYGRTTTSINTERSAIFSALLIPASVSQIRKQRIRYHAVGYVLHTLNLILGYLLMLAVMSYDAYIMIAVILGSGVGYFIFGAVNARNARKFKHLQSSVYESNYNSRTGLTSRDLTTSAGTVS